MAEEHYTFNAKDYIPDDDLEAVMVSLLPEDREFQFQPRTHGVEEAIEGLNPDRGKVRNDETGK